MNTDNQIVYQESCDTITQIDDKLEISAHCPTQGGNVGKRQMDDESGALSDRHLHAGGLTRVLLSSLSRGKRSFISEKDSVNTELSVL